MAAEIERLRMRPDPTKAIGILPDLGTRAGQIIGDAFFSRNSGGAAFHRPVIPRDVQRGEIHEGRWAELSPPTSSREVRVPAWSHGPMIR